MQNNIIRDDLDVLIDYLKQDDPILTQSSNVSMFEKEWSKWLGVGNSVFVNSGGSANLITMAVLKSLYGNGEIIVPTLTWSSDVASVIQNGFEPIFVDINPKNLCMDDKQVIEKITDKTKAVFITHVQGFNGLTEMLLDTLRKKRIPLIEDVCESLGATFKGKKLGTYGLISNFSFYYAHHMTTIEGGMVSTDNEEIYELLRMLRYHGMVREEFSKEKKDYYIKENPELSSEFIFALPGYNVRNTELNAILGRNQLKRIDKNNEKRKKNFELFLNKIDQTKFRTDFNIEGSCNYAFNLILKKPDLKMRDKVERILRNSMIEFRRGSSGGGNQLRQPYLKGLVKKKEWENYPEVEHIHFFCYYIGNYPDLEEEKIVKMCELLNKA